MAAARDDQRRQLLGHQELFEALGAQAPDPNAVMRAPVQVMEGNYQRMSGVCPWWDSLQRN